LFFVHDCKIICSWLNFQGRSYDETCDEVHWNIDFNSDIRVALIILVPGSDRTIRVNGAAEISFDEHLGQTLAVESRLPRSVVVVSMGKTIFQCARELMRTDLRGAEEVTPRQACPAQAHCSKQ